MRRARASFFGAIALLFAAATFAQQPTPLTVDLKVSASHFPAGEPIMVDVWIENQTDKEIRRPRFSPISSIVGLPKFVVRREPGGWGFAIPPGLYGEVESWASWYQPAAQFPAGGRVHLLRGDLRQTLLNARAHCQRTLQDEKAWTRPDTASTKASYEDIVRLVDDFLGGRTFDISVDAYVRSQAVRVTVEPEGSR